MDTKTEALSELEVEREKEEKVIELGDALVETRGGPLGVIMEGGFSYFKQG